MIPADYEAEFLRVVELVGPELWHDDVIVNTALEHLHEGRFSAETALVVAVQTLANRNKELRDQVRDFMMHCTGCRPIVVDGTVYTRIVRERHD